MNLSIKILLMAVIGDQLLMLMGYVAVFFKGKDKRERTVNVPISTRVSVTSGLGAGDLLSTTQ